MKNDLVFEIKPVECTKRNKNCLECNDYIFPCTPNLYVKRNLEKLENELENNK